MSLVTAHELSYDLEKALERGLRSARVPSARKVAVDLVPYVMDRIPSEAFDPVQPWTDGHLVFHGDVDEETVINAQYEIMATHRNIKPDKELTLHLSSYGGGCYAGLALVGTIQQVRRDGRKVNAHVSGYAMSMGSLVLQACDRRTIDDNAWLMIHEVNYWNEGKTSAHEDYLEHIKRLQDGLYAMYSKRTGKPIEHYRKWLHKQDVYLTAAQALEHGLVDEVKSTPEFKKFRKKAA